MIINNMEKYGIDSNATIKSAVQKMDDGGIGFIVVLDEKERVFGVISNGDFRRAVLNGISLNENVRKIVNPNFKYLNEGHTDDDITRMFKNKTIQHIPIIKNDRLINIITEEEFFGIRRCTNKAEKLDLPVILMAGGKGTRLDPFTRVLPKPLVPIGEKPVIELIIDKFTEYGIVDFYVSVNYKARMIKSYFDDIERKYNIHYIEEDKPLGTIGAIKLLEGKVSSTFFSSNCDIILKENYSEIYEFHKQGRYILTLVCSLKHHKVPYGVCEIHNGGELKSITEKPEYDLLANAGMYVLEPEILDFIPNGKKFDITDLINVLMKKGRKIGVCPVSQGAWIDVGQWEEYGKALRGFKLD